MTVLVMDNQPLVRVDFASLTPEKAYL